MIRIPAASLILFAGLVYLAYNAGYHRGSIEGETAGACTVANTVMGMRGQAPVKGCEKWATEPAKEKQ